MTALRILVFSTGIQKFHSAIYANAWYVFFLIFLPARLGEFAGIYVLQKHMQQTRGAAMMSIIIQRMLDLIILSIIFILLLTLAYNYFSTFTSLTITLAFIIALSIIFKFRMNLITYFALKYKNITHTKQRPIARIIYRTLLQARLWNKQFSNTKKTTQPVIHYNFKMVI